MQQEIASIHKNKTWLLEDLPVGVKPITCKWVYRLKPEIPGTPPTHKARLVARGFEQKPGIDYDETFAPVVKWVTIRATVALAASKRWDIHHMDVRTAFLHGVLKENVFMKQPPGFEVPGHEHKVCKLLRSLYGLKQSPRAWYEKIDSALRQIRLLRSSFDHNLYYLHQDNNILIVMLYVDDLLITGSSSKMVKWIKHFLQQTFDMTDLGQIQKYLGVLFEYFPQGILLHQKEYTESIIEQFLPEGLHTAKVPLPAGTHLVCDTGTPPVDSTHYSKLVGKLIFLTITRPDISFAVNRIASFMASPQTAHMESALHILRYLKGTTDLGLLYEHGTPLNVCGYTDADWGTCADTRRSIGAYLFTAANGSISWQSKKQLTVSRSSTESEYRALSDGVQEAVWLSRLLQELQVLPSLPTPVCHSNEDISLTLPNSIQLHCDNQSAIKLARNPVFHARSKHIEIHHHFVRESLRQRNRSQVYCHCLAAS